MKLNQKNKISLASNLRKRERILFLSRRFFHDRGFVDISPLSLSRFEKEPIKKVFSLNGEILSFFSHSSKELKNPDVFFQLYLVYIFNALKRKSLRLGNENFTPFTLKYVEGKCVVGGIVLSEWVSDSKYFSGQIGMEVIFEVFECRV